MSSDSAWNEQEKAGMNISTAQIREDIAYFEQLVDELDRQSVAGEEPDVADYYRPFIERRRNFLAAVEAGRPQDWRSFGPGL